MKVKELIKALQGMPPDAEVTHLWEGEPRTSIEVVYLARSGLVVTADYNQFCFSTESRPRNAPTMEELPYWATQNFVQE